MKRLLVASFLETASFSSVFYPPSFRLLAPHQDQPGKVATAPVSRAMVRQQSTVSIGSEVRRPAVGISKHILPLSTRSIIITKAA